MSTLRIKDAHLLPDVNGSEKIPTGGRGDLAISMDQVKTFAQGGLPQQIEDHINDTENPHQVSKSQVGLGNVDNTSDIDKPVSTAQQEALNLKADKVTTYTKIEVDSRLGLKADKTAVHSKSATLPTYYIKEDGVYPVTGVTNGAYFNVRSTDEDTMLVEYQNAGGSAVPTGKRYLSAYGVEQQEKPASTIKDVSGLSQQEINGARVVAVDSIADLLALPEGQRKEGLRYEVASYYADWDVESPDSVPVGGGAFIWVANSEVDADSVLVFSSGGAVGRFIRVVEGDNFFAVWAGLRPNDAGDQAVTMQAAYDVFVKGFREGRYNSFTLPEFEVKLSQLKLSNPMTYTGEMKQQRFLGGHITHIGADFLFTKTDASNVQMVRWDGTHFTGTDGHGPLVDADSMRRLYFSGCGFRSVNTAVYSTAYTQSIYFIDGCSVFRGSGWFIDVHNLFDVVITDSQLESRQHGVRTRSVSSDPAANSLRVTNNVIQGFTGQVFSLGACYGSTISENYFEANQGGDIDCSAGTAFHKGLTIQSNGFQPTAAQKADPNYASIRWGKGASGFTSGGNYSTGKLHALDSASEAWLDFSNDGALGQLVIGTTPLSQAGRSPVGRTEYWEGTGKALAWSNRFMRLDPWSAGFMFGGAGRSEDLGDGTQANTWFRFGSNPTPGNYPGIVFKQGSRILNTSPELMGDAGSRYIVTEWVCLKSGVIGSGAVFQEIRVLTGT